MLAVGYLGALSRTHDLAFSTVTTSASMVEQNKPTKIDPNLALSPIRIHLDCRGQKRSGTPA